MVMCLTNLSILLANVTTCREQLINTWLWFLISTMPPIQNNWRNLNTVMGSLENTPTWAVSIVCFFFFLISFTIDAGLHHLTQVSNNFCIYICVPRVCLLWDWELISYGCLYYNLQFLRRRKRKSLNRALTRIKTG